MCVRVLFFCPEENSFPEMGQTILSSSLCFGFSWMGQSLLGACRMPMRRSCLPPASWSASGPRKCSASPLILSWTWPASW